MTTNIVLYPIMRYMQNGIPHRRPEKLRRTMTKRDRGAGQVRDLSALRPVMLRCFPDAAQMRFPPARIRSSGAAPRPSGTVSVESGRVRRAIACAFAFRTRTQKYTAAASNSPLPVRFFCVSAPSVSLTPHVPCVFFSARAQPFVRFAALRMTFLNIFQILLFFY